MSLVLLFQLPVVTGAGGLVAQAASADGAGVSSSTGAGTPTSQAAVVDGAGISSSTGTGALAAQSSAGAGEGGVEWVASGALAAQAASVDGAGVSSSTGTGALAAPAAAIDGSGTSSSAGSGALSAQSGDVTGLGSAYTPNPDACKFDSTVTSWDSTGRTFDETTCAAPVGVTGSGALSSAVASIEGDGISGSAGIGAQNAQSATVSGSGQVSGGLVIFDLVDHATPEVLKVVRGDGSLRAPRAKVRGNGSVSWNDDNERFLMMAA